MPLTKEKESRYPGGSLRSPEWLALREWALFRAKNKCMPCGADNGRLHPVTRSKVVLTVAHLDHNPANNVWHNLKAMCQRCHLTYDAPLHRKHAAETRRAKMNNHDLFPGA